MAHTHERTNGAAGDSVSTQSKLLETGASVVQDFSPIKSICAHLNALHVYASDENRCVEANHYCSHISEDVRQCLIYDAPTPGARLIGIEYMITPRIYATLSTAERSLWHSHVFEVKSGMLIMPKPSSAALMPDVMWDAAETKEMEQVIGLYGKTYHLWQVDRGDVVPMGGPELMMSFTKEEQLKEVGRGLVDDRNERYGIQKGTKVENRAYIEEPNTHEDADMMWKDTSKIGAESN